MIPPPSFRFSAQADGWMAWLVIPHPITRTSLLVDTSGAVEMVIEIWHGAVRQAWRVTLRDGDAPSLSTVPLQPALGDPQLARDGRGVAWLFGLEPPERRRAWFSPLDDPSAVRRVPLAAGHTSLALLPSAKLVCRFTNPRTFATVRVIVGDGDGEPTTLELPRGFTLGELIELDGGYVLIGVLKKQTVVLHFDAEGTMLPPTPCSPPVGVQVHAVLGARADGTLVALGSKGNVIGEVVFSPEADNGFEPQLTLPVDVSTTLQLQALSIGLHAPRSAILSWQAAAGARSGWAAVRFADGRPASWLGTRSDRPGQIERSGGAEKLDDTHLTFLGYDQLDSCEAALFAREPPSGGTGGSRLIARVWR